MEDKVITKLSVMTEKMYTSIVGQIKNGYFSIWNPRFEELNMIMEALISDYNHCKKGKILQEHFSELLKYQEQVRNLPKAVFEDGDLEAMELIQRELPPILSNMKAAMEQGVRKYDQVEASVNQVDEYEREFINASSSLVSEYKLKLRNRINQNLGKVQQFETLSAEERRYFMTHVIFFDEGKIENCILEYLNEAERKVEQDVLEVEREAIIAPEFIDLEESPMYVKRYREEAGRQSPHLLSISRKLLKEGEMENKFESWFNSLIGENSSVGQLISEGKKSYEAPIEEQMFQAVEAVLDNNLGNLNMREMLDAYKQECVMIKEKSFEEFYGDYQEIENLIFIVDKALQLFPQWKARDVSIADIILGEY